jgi:hypothetical protein
MEWMIDWVTSAARRDHFKHIEVIHHAAWKQWKFCQITN